MEKETEKRRRERESLFKEATEGKNKHLPAERASDSKLKDGKSRERKKKRQEDTRE